MEKIETKNEVPEESIEIDREISFDERRKELKVVTSGENKGVKKEYTDVFNRDAIKNLTGKMQAEVDSVNKMIQDADKNIETQEDLKRKLLKEAPTLNERQKALIEDLKIVQDYTPIENCDIQVEAIRLNIEKLKEQLKEKKQNLHEVKAKCKGLKL